MSTTDNSKSFHTKKSLNELQDQIRTCEAGKTEDDEDIDQVSDESDYETDKNNIIIKNFQANTKANSSSIKSCRDDPGNIISTLLLQRELDRNKLNKLTKKFFKVQMLTDREETKNHYMKLELNNTNISLDKSKEKLKQQSEKLSSTCRSFFLCKLVLIFSIVFNLLWFGDECFGLF